jgi:hypothetical protein
MCVCVHIYTHLHTNIHLRVYLCVDVHITVSMYVYTQMYMYTHTNACVCTQTNACVCIKTCMIIYRELFRKCCLTLMTNFCKIFFDFFTPFRLSPSSRCKRYKTFFPSLPPVGLNKLECWYLASLTLANTVKGALLSKNSSECSPKY